MAKKFESQKTDGKRKKMFSMGVTHEGLITLMSSTFLFFKDFIYVFLDRGEGREKERETLMCGCLLCAPYWGTGPSTQA